MKYLIGAACAIIISLAFNSRKCEHIFVSVEQEALKIKRPSLPFDIGVYQPYSYLNGLQEGKQLICVKCFRVQKQLLDYGKPDGPGLTQTLNGAALDSSFFTHGILMFDTCVRFVGYDSVKITPPCSIISGAAIEGHRKRH